MAKKRVVSFAWAIFVLMLFVAASIDAQDFSIAKDSGAMTVCPGSTLLVRTTVSSATGGSFTVSQSGDASKFSITVPTGFILSAGESKTIFSYVTPPSTTYHGAYSLSAIASSSGISKSADYSIIVDDCRASSLQMEEAKEICPGEAATFTATLKNEGKYTEDYSIGVEGPASAWATLSDTFARLDAGEQKEIFVFLTLPIDKTGEFGFTLAATSESGIFASSGGRLNVLPCYNYELSAEKALYSLCEAEQLMIPLTLENKGTVANTFKLTLDAQDFAALEKDTIALASGEIVNANLILNPSYGVQGDFPAEVTIESKLGKIRKVLPLVTRIEKCYGAQVQIASETATVCNSFSTQQEVLVKNLGRSEVTFSLSLEGPDFVSLNPGTLTLTSGEESSVVLTAFPQEGTSAKTYIVKVTATDSVSGAFASDSIKIITIAREECFRPSITSAQRSIDVAKDSSAAVQFTIENKGREKASYVLEMSGNALPFVQINPSSITLEAGKSETVFLHLAPSISTAEGNYKVTVTARVEDSQISSSETVSIGVLPAAGVPAITPSITGSTTGTGEGERKSLLDSIRNFLRRLFRIDVVPDEGEGAGEAAEGEAAEGEAAEGEAAEGEAAEEQLEDEESDESTTGLSIQELEQMAELQETTGETAGEAEQTTEKKSVWQRIKEYFTFEVIKPNANATGEAEGQGPGESESGENVLNIFEKIAEQSESGEEQQEETEEPVSEEGEEETEREIISDITQEERKPLITGQAVKGFFSGYAYHIIAALILIVIIVIVATGYWKRIVDFFVEEEEVADAGKEGKKKGKK